MTSRFVKISNMFSTGLKEIYVVNYRKYGSISLSPCACWISKVNVSETSVHKATKCLKLQPENNSFFPLTEKPEAGIADGV
jgi:hypothetical protein